jgi:hypothetical protein
MAVKKLNRGMVEDMVRFLVHDPSLEGKSNALMAAVRRFEHAGNDELAATFDRVVALLRTYVQLDDVEACVLPRAEVVPPAILDTRRTHPGHTPPEIRPKAHPIETLTRGNAL